MPKQDQRSTALIMPENDEIVKEPARSRFEVFTSQESSSSSLEPGSFKRYKHIPLRDQPPRVREKMEKRS